MRKAQSDAALVLKVFFLHARFLHFTSIRDDLWRLTDPLYFSRETNLPLLFTALNEYKSFCLASARHDKVSKASKALRIVPIMLWDCSDV